MIPRLHVLTRARPTPLISACMAHLRSHAEITSDADVLLSVQYDRIISPDTLSRYRLALNIHNAKLPEYCGFNTLEWAIANGERTYTSTMHHMIEQVDAGPIAYEAMILIHRGECWQSLYRRTIHSCITLIDCLLSDLAAGREVPRREQTGERRFYARKEHPITGGHHAT